MARTVRPGSPEPFGVVPVGDGVNAAFPSAAAHAVELCLFDATGEHEIERIPLAARTGSVFHAHVAGIAPGQRYGLRVHGPFDPARGHRFNPAKLLVDPWATRLDRPFTLHQSLFDARRAGAQGPPDTVDSAPVVPKAILERAIVERAIVESAIAGAPATTAPAPAVRVPWERTVVYEMGVKAFTALHPDVPDRHRGTFAALAHPAVVGHLRDLGVTTVELLPCAAWIDERHLPPLGLANAWGYNPIGFCAPDPRLAPRGWEDVRAATDALHAAGLEVVLDVVLNHSGEADELGPTVSLRGLDNAGFYRLRPDDAALYVNDAGCGNVLALDRPAPLRLAMDALRQWALRGGVDGFRFDLAVTLGRRDAGFDPAAPLLSAIAQDPLLRTLKLIAEPWDIGPGGYHPGAFPASWGEWNDRFRDDVRRCWRDGHGVGALATRFAGSQDVFGARRRPSRSVNFVVAHDGFTLADLVSYAGKHNRANGEDNRDGTDANHSWNTGVEGPSDDPAVTAARRADQRALLATLLFARGTPMLAMGAEAGRSQGGNNNAYAQDNATAWLDWSALDADLLAATRRLCALRARHPALRDDRFLTGQPLPRQGDDLADLDLPDLELPDVEWLRADGQPMQDHDWAGPMLACVLSATDDAAGSAGGQDRALDRVLVAFNLGREPLGLVLPWSRPGFGWRLAFDSGVQQAGAPAVKGEETGAQADGGDTVPLGPRRVLLLVEEPRPRGGRRGGIGIPSDALARLAGAAGIAPEWWEETGVRHAVSDDTRKALLAAMGLPVASASDVGDALAQLALRQEGRDLPPAVLSWHGEALAVPVAASAFARAGALLVTGEDGATRTVPLPADAPAGSRRGVDGRVRSHRRVALPDLGIGRWRLALDTAPERACALTVAPRRCHLPDWVAAGERRIGLAAHLYAVRREGDQGIGDFTSLAQLGRETAAAGAVTLGLNPLHALFAGDRDRASPYQPSDRRFLDPIYLDVAALDGNDATEIAEVGATDTVDYRAVWERKSAILRRVFGIVGHLSDDHPDRRDFAAFRQAGGAALARFAAFEALAEHNPGPWQSWPASLRDVRTAVSAADPESCEFHSWLQFLCDRHLGEAAKKSILSLGLYRDLAVGAAPDGAEIWSDPSAFALGASIGAPPDLFSRDGQVWMLPPPNPLVQAERGGADFAALVAANMRHAGALRIDHVMGLSRLFWVPDGARGADGAYVSAPFQTLAGQLALESQRARTLVVGEDLGTVPAGFRDELAAADILSYRVLWFERQHDAFVPPAAWPSRAVACASTHDMPTLRGWWTGADIAERRALGVLAAADAAAASREREQDVLRIMELLTAEGLAPEASGREPDLPAAVAEALHALVARTPSVLALAQLDDLAGETMAVNLPGTDRERPNWRRRMAWTISGIFRDPQVLAQLAAMRSARP